jgi:hypothetical protein
MYRLVAYIRSAITQCPLFADCMPNRPQYGVTKLAGVGTVLSINN